MILSTALKAKEMDVRLRDKLVAEEKLQREDLAKYLNSLPDESNNLVYTDVIDERAKKAQEAASTDAQ